MKYLRTIKRYKKVLISTLPIACVALIIFASQIARAEWIEPEGPPPQGSFYPPLTTSGEHQAKEGKLKIDPLYNPTDEKSLTYLIDRTLDIEGEGALFSTSNVYTNLLTVDNSTLFADAYNDWVGIGTDERSPDILFKVDGGTMQVASTDDSTVQAVSSNGLGIYGDAGATGEAGIYGYNSGSAGFAVLGESQNNVGIRGESPSGYGIYATTQATDQGAVYGSNAGTGLAAYFDGMLGAGYDVVSKNFRPTDLQQSLVSFTSGSEIAVYDIGVWNSAPETGPDTATIAFDGTYIWTTSGTPDDSKSGDNLFKVRASDGITEKTFAAADLGVCSGYLDIEFDGRYLWLICADSDRLSRFDPVTEDLINVSIADGNSDIEISTINGKTFIWVANGSITTNSVYKVDAEDFSVETYNFTSMFGGAVNRPINLEFDGTYIWVAAFGNYDGTDAYVRLWAEDPESIDHPPVTVDTTSGSYDCPPDTIIYDGEYIWCGPFATLADEKDLLRIWAEDPYDADHPIEEFGPVAGKIGGVTFDGMYLWLSGSASGKLYRVLAADPNQQIEFDLTFEESEKVVFDGTFLWIAESEGDAGDGVRLHKFLSGSGRGITDHNSVVQLQTEYGKCVNDTTYYCMSDADCSFVGGACESQMRTQAGTMNISGDAVISYGHCYRTDIEKHLYNLSCTQDTDCSEGICSGGTVFVGKDVTAENNTWGGTDQIIGIASDTAECPEGQFMIGVNLDASSKISEIVCREL